MRLPLLNARGGGCAREDGGERLVSPADSPAQALCRCITHFLSCLTVSSSLYLLNVSRYSMLFCSTGLAASFAAAPAARSGSSSFSRSRVRASEMLIVLT